MAALESVPRSARAVAALLFLTICAVLTYILVSDDHAAPPPDSRGSPPAAGPTSGTGPDGIGATREPAPAPAPARAGGSKPAPAATASKQPDVATADLTRRGLIRARGLGTPVPDAVIPDDPLARSFLGRVKDPGGVPIAGVVVVLDPSWRWMRAQKDRENFALTTMTGADGSFVLGPLQFDSTRRYQPGASYRLKLKASGYYPEAEWFSLGEERDVVLQVPGSLGGRVEFKNRERTPCAGAKITFTGPQGGRSTAYQVESDVDGRFFQRELRPGSYTVSIEPRNLPPVSQTTVVVRARQHTDVCFQVEKGVTVHGQVTARSTGQPLAGVTVFTAESYESRVVTGPDGRYLLEGLPRKSTVKFYKTGYLPWDESIAVTDKEEAKIADAALLRPATVQGQVVGPDGEPVVGARVAINEIDDRRLVSRAEGAFTISGVWPAENLRVRAWKRGFEGAKSLPFTAGDGETVTNILVRLEPPRVAQEPARPVKRLTPREWMKLRQRVGAGTATGTVLDPEGKPVAGATVELHRTYRMSNFRNDRSAYRYYYSQPPFLTTRTDAWGNFGFERLPTGSFFVGVRAENYLEKEGEEFELPEASPPHQEIIRLARGFWVDAVFQDQEGRPVRRTHVSLTRHSQRFGERMRFVTDAEGKARIGPVGHERYWMLCLKRGIRYDSKEVTFQKGETQVITVTRMTLAVRGGEIRGTVFRGDTGAPAQEFWIVLHGAAGKVEQRFADSQGRFTWSRLEDGAYQVEARTDDGWVTRATAEAAVTRDTATPPLMLMVYEGDRVEGVVLDPFGEPLGGAHVTIHSGHRLTHRVATAKSESDGAFKIVGLVPGEYVAVAAHEQWVEGSTPFTLAVGVSPRIRIRTLEEGGTAAVVAVDSAGRPVHGAALTITRLNGNIFVPTAAQIERHFRRLQRTQPTLKWGPFYISFYYTDRNGRLLHPFIPPGRYRFRASKGSLVSRPVEVQVFDRRRTAVRLVLEPAVAPVPAGK